MNKRRYRSQVGSAVRTKHFNENEAGRSPRSAPYLTDITPPESTRPLVPYLHRFLRRRVAFLFRFTPDLGEWEAPGFRLGPRPQ